MKGKYSMRIGIKLLVIFLILDQFVVCHPYNIQAVSFQDISGQEYYVDDARMAQELYQQLLEWQGESRVDGFYTWFGKQIEECGVYAYYKVEYRVHYKGVRTKKRYAYIKLCHMSYYITEDGEKGWADATVECYDKMMEKIKQYQIYNNPRGISSGVIVIKNKFYLKQSLEESIDAAPIS